MQGANGLPLLYYFSLTAPQNPKAFGDCHQESAEHFCQALNFLLPYASLQDSPRNVAYNFNILRVTAREKLQTNFNFCK